MRRRRESELRHSRGWVEGEKCGFVVLMRLFFCSYRYHCIPYTACVFLSFPVHSGYGGRGEGEEGGEGGRGERESVVELCFQNEGSIPIYASFRRM